MFAQGASVQEIRRLQNDILKAYENDFSKHAPVSQLPRIRLVWNSIVSQLSKENTKFIFNVLRPGARAKDFELAINWLVDAGLILKVNRITKPTLPLNAYMDMDAFKLFLVDIGLLNAMGNLDARILLEKNSILLAYKGALTEQFVCQQLTMAHQLFYWTAESSTAEIDFVLQYENEAIPIEVKAEENLKAKSLKLFVEKFKIKTAFRTSMNKYREQEWLTNIPLYAVEEILT
jgi:predicted AAA+ superfamily ATPase